MDMLVWWKRCFPLSPDAGGCSNLEQVINDILLWIYQHISWWTSRSMKLWSIQLFGCDHYIHTVAIETCTTAGYANKCVHCESLHSQSWITWDYPMKLYEYSWSYSVFCYYVTYQWNCLEWLMCEVAVVFVILNCEYWKSLPHNM